MVNTLSAPGDPLEGIEGIGDSGGGHGDSSAESIGVGSNNIPHGVSMRRILLTLAKNAKILGAFKLARWAYSRVDMMVVPENEVRYCTRRCVCTCRVCARTPL